MNNKLKNMIILLIAISMLSLIGCFGEKSTESKNTAPVINSVTVNPPIVNTNGTATVTVLATDTENQAALSYTYQPNGGAITGSGSQVVWTAPGTAGAYSVTVKVSDGVLEDEMTGNLTVTAPPVVTQVTGTASFPPGVNSNLNNAQVALYTSLANWVNYSPIKFVSVTGSGASVTYTIPNVIPGNYYLDVWKDNDNDTVWSLGDFVGWYGSGAYNAPVMTEFQIAEGQTIVINVNMVVI